MTNAVALAQGASNNVTFRNRIINGAMVIDQRNAGASVTPASGSYTLDRWIVETSQASKFSLQQNQGSVTPPTGFSNYLGITSLANTSLGAGDYFIFEQRIEGFNTADLDFGKSTAKTITLSFWVRSSLTGTFGGALGNNAGNRSYPFTYTISFANTWTQISITIAGDTSGTWVTNNLSGLIVYFGLGMGSTYSGTAGAWASALYFSATGATSVVGTNGATFYITGVQLEAGSTASPFEYRQYGTELALCQRYYWVGLNYSIYGNGSVGAFSAASVYTSSSGNAYGSLMTPVPMRTSPSVAVSTGVYLNSISGNTNTGSGVLSFSLNSSSGVQNSQFLYYTISWSVAGSSGVSNQLAWLNCGSGGVLAFSAEL